MRLTNPLDFGKKNLDIVFHTTHKIYTWQTQASPFSPTINSVAAACVDSDTARQLTQFQHLCSSLLLFMIILMEKNI